MTGGRSEFRSLKIRRRGRHKTPSQVEKVAEKAGKAAPAVAMAGALVAVPTAQHAFTASAKTAAVAVAAADAAKPAAHEQRPAAATLDSVATHSVVVSSASKARHAARVASAKNTYYKVQTGDTLSSIAQRFYHNASDWQWLYHENDKTISDPNLIYTGETLYVPADPPAHYTLPSDYVPRHAKPGTTSHGGKHRSSGSAVTVQTHGSSGSSYSGWGSSGGSGSAAGGTLSGTLGCTGLEELWDQAGGNPSDAFMAAEIAMAESGGNQYALSPTDDYGYWQINISNGSLATFNAYGNARSAIIISHDGTDWYPWTTYTSGAYYGRC